MGPVSALLLDPVFLVLHAVAVFRVTRLITTDMIFAGPRDRLVAHLDEPHPLLAYFVTCPWCVSVWVAALWLPLALLLPVPAAIVAAPLAWSAAAGLLSKG